MIKKNVSQFCCEQTLETTFYYNFKITSFSTFPDAIQTPKVSIVKLYSVYFISGYHVLLLHSITPNLPCKIVTGSILCYNL
jgi:hypothetical protein